MPASAFRGVILALVGLVPLPIAAQDPYRQPVPAIARVLDAPQTPIVLPSPDRTRLLLLGRPSLPAIEEVAAPEVRLAGIRLNPRTNAPSRLATYTSLSVLPIGGAEQPIALPAAVEFASPPFKRLYGATGLLLSNLPPCGGDAR